MKRTTACLILMLLLAFSSSAQEVFNFQPGAACVAIENLNLRAADDIGSRRIATLKAGTQVTVCKRGRKQTVDYVRGCWVNVMTPDGRIGWCFSEYLMKQPGPNLSAELLGHAEKSTLEKLESSLSRKLRGGLCLDGEDKLLFTIDLHRINKSTTQDQVGMKFWIILWATERATGKKTIRCLYSDQIQEEGNQLVYDNNVEKTKDGYATVGPDDQLEPFLPWMKPGLYDVTTYVVFDDDTYSKGSTVRVKL